MLIQRSEFHLPNTRKVPSLTDLDCFALSISRWLSQPPSPLPRLCLLDILLRDFLILLWDWLCIKANAHCFLVFYFKSLDLKLTSDPWLPDLKVTPEGPVDCFSPAGAAALPLFALHPVQAWKRHLPDDFPISVMDRSPAIAQVPKSHVRCDPSLEPSAPVARSVFRSGDFQTPTVPQEGHLQWQRHVGSGSQNSIHWRRDI